MRKIVFIGAGHMAAAIMGGLYEHNEFDVYACDHHPEKLDALQKKYRITPQKNTHEASLDADIIILAVKPQVINVACQEIKEAVEQHNPLVISVAAGINMAHLNQFLAPQTPIVRCMPNTPALVCAGASGLFANQYVSFEQKDLATTIFNAIGVSRWVNDEHLIDVITALSGSGPAYYFLFMEAMIATAIEMGLDKKTARQLTEQTCLGAALMAKQHDGEISQLRENVTSKGGATAAALDSFKTNRLQETIHQAMLAAKQRTVELAQSTTE